MACCPCGACSFNDSDCLAYQYSVTISSFTGSCVIFNGTWTVTFDINNTYPICGSPPTAQWVKQLSGVGNYICVTLAWSDITFSNDTITLFANSAQVAQYTRNGFGGWDCNETSQTMTLNLSSSTCTSPPATISISSLATSPGPWSCDCKAQLPFSTTMHLTITNSTCGCIPNGTYAMVYNQRLSDPVGWNYVGGLLFWWTFELDYFGAGASPSCANRVLEYQCSDISYDITSTAVAGCTCNPITASGHMSINDGDPGNCCGGPCSFDWSVAP